jgi:hypothetical protein
MPSRRLESFEPIETGLRSFPLGKSDGAVNELSGEGGGLVEHFVEARDLVPTGPRTRRREAMLAAMAASAW